MTAGAWSCSTKARTTRARLSMSHRTSCARSTSARPARPERDPPGKVPPRPAGAAGVVEALLTANHAEHPWRSTGASGSAGRHVVGDRYFDGTGTFSASEKRGQELTLIEAEVLDALRDKGLELAPVDARRNIVTRGINTNTLVSQGSDRNRPLRRPTLLRAVLTSAAPHRSRATAPGGPPRRPPRDILTSGTSTSATTSTPERCG